MTGRIIITTEFPSLDRAARELGLTAHQRQAIDRIVDRILAEDGQRSITGRNGARTSHAAPRRASAHAARRASRRTLLGTAAKRKK